MIPNAWTGFDFGLGEDLDRLRDTVRGFADEKIAPRAAEIDSSNAFPRDLWPQMGALGLHGITVEEELGGAGMGYLAHCVSMEEISRASASVGLSYGAHSNLCVNQIRRNGTAEQKARYLPKLDFRRPCGRACHVGARGRLRRGVDAHPRREARRPLRGQRQQDVDHQRAGRRYPYRLRQDRSRRRGARHYRVHHRKRLQGLCAGAKARQARHARLRYLRARFHRLRSAGRERARRRRQRRQRADVRSRLRAAGAGRRTARHHAGLSRSRDPLPARPQAVRSADRALPADAGETRGHVCDS